MLMTSAESPPPSQRIASLDVLRGVAICGILLMNIVGMGMTGRYPLTTFPARWNAEWVSWSLQTLFVQGAMRGLFTLLFGASMLLMLRRAEQGDVAPVDAWARRSIALMGFGILQFALFLWPGEILWNYGVSGLFLLAFRTARPRTLLAAAALLLVALSVNSAHWTGQEVQQLREGSSAAAAAAQGSVLDAEQRAAVRAETSERAEIHQTAATREREIDRRTHIATLFRWSAGYWTEQNIGFTGWVDVAESVAFMLIGMALFRWGVLTGEAPGRTYRWMMIAGYGGGLALRGLEVWLAIRTGLDRGVNLVSPGDWVLADALFEPARLLVTLGHVGLIATLLRAGWLGSASTLRMLGRMTLTVYCLQSILGSLLFYGLGYFGAFTLPQLWGFAVGIWVVTALFCRWWFGRHTMGPAEQVLRRIAYGRREDRVVERVARGVV